MSAARQPGTETNQTLRVPAEWEPAACVWLAWPHNQQTWPGRFDPVPRCFADWIHLIAESTPVRVLVASPHVENCRSLLPDRRGIDLIEIPTNDCWIRDFGPTFVQRNSSDLQGISWRYNAWGGKYPPWDLDDAAAREICRVAEIECVESRLGLEGGAIEVDGRGHLLTTAACLESDSRNPGWTRADIECELMLRLGIHQVVWLDCNGVEGDDTDGHVDQLVRFVDTQNIVAASCDRADPNSTTLRHLHAQLCRWRDTAVPGLQIHELPLPPPRRIDGQRVPESYCNFQRLGPERILMPTFGATTDDTALGILCELSGCDVTGVDCRDLTWGLGALHCASREQPAVS